MVNIIIPVFIINLECRADRRRHILRQFTGREEFQVNIVEAYKDVIGAKGLWNSILHTIKQSAHLPNDFIILCEDDHQFTKSYSKEKLLLCIREAEENNADFLSCGVSGFTSAKRVTRNLYWVEKFSGLQFTIIFRKFFQSILNADFRQGDAADYKLCTLTKDKFFLHPFLSTQKDFGYSDVTAGNGVKGHVEKVFVQSNEKVHILNSVSAYYLQRKIATTHFKLNQSPDKIIIPAYIIHLPERRKRFIHAKNQFRGRAEFDVTIVKASKHKIGAVSMWLSISKIIETAIKNDDDLILICKDDHEFTLNYNRVFFVKSVWQAACLGCSLLIGGTGKFNMCIPVTDELCWIDSFSYTQFIVIYRNLFERILNEVLLENDTVGGKFSELASQKMVIYPFISKQKYFESPDDNANNQSTRRMIANCFENSDERFSVCQKIYKKYNNQIV